MRTTKKCYSWTRRKVMKGRKEGPSTLSVSFRPFPQLTPSRRSRHNCQTLLPDASLTHLPSPEFEQTTVADVFHTGKGKTCRRPYLTICIVTG